MAADWAGLVSSHAKPVKVYSQKAMSGSKAKLATASALSRCLGSMGIPFELTPLSAWVFGRLFRCRGSQYDLGPTWDHWLFEDKRKQPPPHFVVER
ncbi:hypothetical protein TNCV_1057371 [Trichonephila clavipes]|nr:hypothetical protein TNCV_1057371 [Trichonephila clavipes]